MDSSNTSAFGRPEESMISSFKHNREMIYERIGYNPTPRNPQWLSQFTCYYTSSLHFISLITYVYCLSKPLRNFICKDEIAETYLKRVILILKSETDAT